MLHIIHEAILIYIFAYHKDILLANLFETALILNIQLYSYFNILLRSVLSSISLSSLAL